MNRVKVMTGVAIAGALVAGITVRQARAATATSNLAVTATVAANCQIDNGSLTFTTPYDALVTNAGTDATASGTFNVRCNKGTAYHIGLGNGGHYSGGTRRMASPSDFLEYELCQDAACNVPWGDADPNRFARTSPGKANDPIPVYGRIRANQDVDVGIYADTVVMTIEY